MLATNEGSSIGVLMGVKELTATAFLDAHRNLAAKRPIPIGALLRVGSEGVARSLPI